MRKYCRLNKEKINHSTAEKVGAPKSDLKESDVKIMAFECVIQIKTMQVKKAFQTNKMIFMISGRYYKQRSATTYYSYK